ncbi:hypothetical protein X946_3669 [Burkholderia sp. ABCPW 111]|nr:hypothetical protein X946_3669 [Burkholderia sp. ABCPW 111]
MRARAGPVGSSGCGFGTFRRRRAASGCFGVGAAPRGRDVGRCDVDRRRKSAAVAGIRNSLVAGDSIFVRRSSHRDRRPGLWFRAVTSTLLRTANGERRTANGERRTANGERRTANGDRRPPTADRRPPTADRRPSSFVILCVRCRPWRSARRRTCRGVSAARQANRTHRRNVDEPAIDKRNERNAETPKRRSAVRLERRTQKPQPACIALNRRAPRLSNALIVSRAVHPRGASAI